VRPEYGESTSQRVFFRFVSSVARCVADRSSFPLLSGSPLVRLPAASESLKYISLTLLPLQSLDRHLRRSSEPQVLPRLRALLDDLHHLHPRHLGHLSAWKRLRSDDHLYQFVAFPRLPFKSCSLRLTRLSPRSCSFFLLSRLVRSCYFPSFHLPRDLQLIPTSTCRFRSFLFTVFTGSMTWSHSYLILVNMSTIETLRVAVSSFPSLLPASCTLVPSSLTDLSSSTHPVFPRT